MAGDGSPLSIAVQMALLAFFEASTPEEELAVFREYPELLDDEMDPIFEEVIENARQGNAPKVMLLFTYRHEMLKLSRAKFRALLAQEPVDPNRPMNAIQRALALEEELEREYVSKFTKFLSSPAWEYLQTQSWEEAMAVLQKYPELLDESSDPLFESIIEEFRSIGEAEIVKNCTLEHDELKNIRRLAREIGETFAPYLKNVH